eukprot:scpid83730/ scgid35643/ 
MDRDRHGGRVAMPTTLVAFVISLLLAMTIPSTHSEVVGFIPLPPTAAPTVPPPTTRPTTMATTTPPATTIATTTPPATTIATTTPPATTIATTTPPATTIATTTPPATTIATTTPPATTMATTMPPPTTMVNISEVVISPLPSNISAPGANSSILNGNSSLANTGTVSTSQSDESSYNPSDNFGNRDEVRTSFPATKEPSVVPPVSVFTETTTSPYRRPAADNAADLVIGALFAAAFCIVFLAGFSYQICYGRCGRKLAEKLNDIGDQKMNGNFLSTEKGEENGMGEIYSKVQMCVTKFIDHHAALNEDHDNTGYSSKKQWPISSVNADSAANTQPRLEKLDIYLHCENGKESQQQEADTTSNVSAESRLEKIDIYLHSVNGKESQQGRADITSNVTDMSQLDEIDINSVPQSARSQVNGLLGGSTEPHCHIDVANEESPATQQTRKGNKLSIASMWSPVIDIHKNYIAPYQLKFKDALKTHGIGSYGRNDSKEVRAHQKVRSQATHEFDMTSLGPDTKNTAATGDVYEDANSLRMTVTEDIIYDGAVADTEALSKADSKDRNK